MSTGCDLDLETIPLSPPTLPCTCSRNEVTRAPCPALRPVPAALAEIGPCLLESGPAPKNQDLGQGRALPPWLLPRKTEVGADAFHLHMEKQRPRKEGRPHCTHVTLGLVCCGSCRLTPIATPVNLSWLRFCWAPHS